MKVYANGVWHSVAPGSDIAVYLEDGDRKNIAAMIPGAKVYMILADDDRTQDEKREHCAAVRASAEAGT